MCVAVAVGRSGGWDCDARVHDDAVAKGDGWIRCKGKGPREQDLNNTVFRFNECDVICVLTGCRVRVTSQRGSVLCGLWRVCVR